MRFARPTPPADGTKVHWVLLTSLPFQTAEEILRVIDDDDARWTFESYFRVLKSGCSIEEHQLETTPRVASFNAVPDHRPIMLGSKIVVLRF